MATDIATVWNPARGAADWVISGALLQSGDDLTTATIISLFSDRVAEESDPIPDGTDDPRGWWGDDDLGSRLWLLSRSKLNNRTALKVEGYANEALAWMVTDGVAKAVETEASVNFADKRVELLVGIVKPNGTAILQQFGWVWGQIA